LRVGTLPLQFAQLDSPAKTRNDPVFSFLEVDG